MEKIIIYTCITGGYDSLQQPDVVPEDFEFICFVRKGTKVAERLGVWKIEEIPFDWDDLQLLSRYPKLNPQSALSDASQWSLWLDGNLGITGSELYELCRDLVRRDVKYAGVKHPLSDCAYDECVRCLHDRRDTFGNLLRTVRFMRKMKLPRHAGLMENNVIFRKHNDPDVVEFDRWWWECMVEHSHRDQLTHTACLMDTPGLKTEYIFPEGVSARNYPGLRYIKHPKKELSWLQRKLKYGPNRIECPLLKAYIELSDASSPCTGLHV